MHATVRIIPLYFFALLLLQSCGALRSTGSTPKSSGSYSSGTDAKLRQKIVNDAEDFLGSNYCYAGRTPKTGFDCSGFTSFIMGRHGIKLSTSSATQSGEGKKIPLERSQPGDLIFFKDTNGKIQHVALVAKNSKEGIFCIHSTSSRGVVIDNISTSSYWKPRIWIARDVISK